MNATSCKMPNFLSLKAVASLTRLPEYTIRRLFLEGKIVGFRSGKKILINTDKLNEFLNSSKN